MSIASPSSQVPEPVLELAGKLHKRTFDPATTSVKGDFAVLEADESGDKNGDCLRVVLQDGEGEWSVTGYRHFFRDQYSMLVQG